MQCRSHASQLGRLYKEFQAKNFEILLILGGTVDEARRYVELLHLPFPVLADPERQIYRLYGLDRVIGLIQRTLSLVIDQSGVVRYLRSQVNPMPWLKESQELLDFIRTFPGESAG